MAAVAAASGEVRAARAAAARVARCASSAPLSHAFAGSAHPAAPPPRMQTLQALRWESGERLRLAALPVPAPTLALLLQRLRTADLYLAVGKDPSAWLHQLRSLERLSLVWPSTASPQPALHVVLPPSITKARLADVGYEAEPCPRPLLVDLRLCTAALQELDVFGFTSARLEHAARWPRCGA